MVTKEELNREIRDCKDATALMKLVQFGSKNGLISHEEWLEYMGMVRDLSNINSPRNRYYISLLDARKIR